MDRPLACWEGSDRYRDEILPSLTIILKTSGCRHNRCRMCSYRFERHASGGDAAGQIRSQLRWVKEHHDLQGIRMVKIFTSGSFFDPAEVPPEAAVETADLFSGKLVVAETRPEYVSGDRIGEFCSQLDTGSFDTPLMVAMGVETSSDFIRDKCIDKGFSWEDFLHAAGEARRGGAGVKAYLLHKPLFLTESEAREDMDRSIRDLSGIVDTVSMNPCTVQRNTEVEYYWRRGAYRPPYLWSVLSILLASPVTVTCDPVGGGKARGPHNCGRCDREIVKALREYNLTGDRDLLAGAFDTGCGCRDEWEHVVSHEMPYAMPLTR